MATTQDVLTANEAAELLRTRPETLKRLARQGKVPGVKLGRRWRFRRQDLEGLFDEAYERVVDQGLVEMVAERMADDEGVRIPWEQVKAESEALP